MSGISLKNNKNFLEGMRLIEEDRKIDPEFVYETLKEAMAKAYQKHIASSHFQRYKQGTLHMVKDLQLIDGVALVPDMKIKE